MATAQFACRECSMQLSAPVSYMDHLKSPKHQKKVQAHRLLVEMATGGSPVNSSPDVITTIDPSTAGQPSPQVASMPFVWKICVVAMNCEDDLIAHTNGKKHQNTLQREEVLRQLASAEFSSRPSAVTSPPTTSPSSATAPPMSSPMSTMSE
ncbi:hypothetical protein HPB51_007583 [Rhipicephalus microplus]|uniref:C2H2-type domain-containing protein n=1 Tax=Rhipicephalus microplus TaxID=6941 RepID=A0A9J6EFH4_RHIMP|nr:hypothetical protein HPB51_007583 [Rhipicephalus microplus]